MILKRFIQIKKIEKKVKKEKLEMLAKGIELRTNSSLCQPSTTKLKFLIDMKRD